MNKLEKQIERLATLSSAELIQEWKRVYKSAAPSITPALMRMGIAYRLQERALGGLSSQHARHLRSNSGAGGTAPSALASGTQLVRSWNERTIAVTVTDDGFQYENRSYRSLSAIAREVTGTVWSGPRFFGLANTGPQASHG